MNNDDVKTIIQLIKSALKVYHTLRVNYNSPQKEECGYFSLRFGDGDMFEGCDTAIEDDLNGVCNEWNLDAHWDSYNRLDLNAYWDKK